MLTLLTSKIKQNVLNFHKISFFIRIKNFCLLDVNMDFEAKTIFDNAVSMMLLKVDPKFDVS